MKTCLREIGYEDRTVSRSCPMVCLGIYSAVSSYSAAIIS
jgi:hypothetical protein